MEKAILTTLLLMLLNAARSDKALDGFLGKHLDKDDAETVKLALDRSRFMPAADAGLHNASAAGAYSAATIGAQVTVSNFLRVSLVDGRAGPGDGKGRLLSEPPAEIPAGTFATFYASAAGERGDNSDCGGAVQYRMDFGRRKGKSQDFFASMMWQIPWSYQLGRSSYVAVGIHGAINGDMDTIFSTMFNEKKRWFHRSGKGDEYVVFQGGHLLIIGMHNNVYKHRQKMTFLIVSTNANLNANLGGAGAAPSSSSADLNPAKSVGVTGMVVWGVIVFFVAGLIFILVCKLVARVRKKMRAKDAEHEGDKRKSYERVDWEELTQTYPGDPLKNGAAASVGYTTCAKVTTDV